MYRIPYYFGEGKKDLLFEEQTPEEIINNLLEYSGAINTEMEIYGEFAFVHIKDVLEICTCYKFITENLQKSNLHKGETFIRIIQVLARASSEIFKWSPYEIQGEEIKIDAWRSFLSKYDLLEQIDDSDYDNYREYTIMSFKKYVSYNSFQEGLIYKHEYAHDFIRIYIGEIIGIMKDKIILDEHTMSFQMKKLIDKYNEFEYLRKFWK